MIVVKVEMWPHGDESRKYRLGEMRIANDGTGSQGTGSYDAVMLGKRGRRLGRTPVKIAGFPRLRKDVWHLVALVLKAAGRGQ